MCVMTLSIFGITLAASLMFSNQETENYPPAKATYHATEWESVPAWNRSVSGTDVVYGFSRSSSELDKQVISYGAVVVFVKGYDLTGFSKAEKPMGLPFYFMSPDEKAGTCNWNATFDGGAINIGLQMAGCMEESFLKSSSRIQLRYVILSKEFLKQHKLNAQSLRGISYAKLSELMAAAPQV